MLTDLGYATRLVFDALRGVHAILIETNHDEGSSAEGLASTLVGEATHPFTPRASFQHAAARILAELEAPLQHIILGHLSRDCNFPHLALDCAMEGLANSRGGTRASIQCACQDAPGPILRII